MNWSNLVRIGFNQNWVIISRFDVFAI